MKLRHGKAHGANLLTASTVNTGCLIEAQASEGNAIKERIKGPERAEIATKETRDKNTGRDDCDRQE